MGFCVLHYDKQTGSSPGLSQHIERGCYRDGEWVEWHPTNADEKRTHLNRELISGDLSRDKRITKRIKDALGSDFKPKKNQVHALTLIMSASCEDMQRIMDEGKFDDWCKSSIRWAQETHGEDNVVSVVLHMDEKTPHLHVTVVPIVQGKSKDQAYREKKAKAAEEKGIEQKKKRKYKKKDPDEFRLCAADVMARTRLKEYQTTYAEAVADFGLTRGIDGSIAKHIDVNDWYKSLVTEVQALEREINEKKAAKEKLTEDNASLDHSLKDKEYRVGVLESVRNYNEEIIRNQENVISDNKGIIDDLDQKQSTLHQSIDDKQQELESIQLKSYQLDSDNASKEAHLSHLNAEIERTTPMVERLKSARDWLTGESRRRAEKAEQRAAAADERAEKEIAKMYKANKELEEENDKLRKVNQNLQEENDRLHKVNKGLEEYKTSSLWAERLYEERQRLFQNIDAVLPITREHGLSNTDALQLAMGRQVGVDRVTVNGEDYHAKKLGLRFTLRWLDGLQMRIGSLLQRESEKIQWVKIGDWVTRVKEYIQRHTNAINKKIDL